MRNELTYVEVEVSTGPIRRPETDRESRDSSQVENFQPSGNPYNARSCTLHYVEMKQKGIEKVGAIVKPFVVDTTT